MRAIEPAQADVVELIVVEPNQTIRPLRLGEHPTREPFLDGPLLLLAASVASGFTTRLSESFGSGSQIVGVCMLSACSNSFVPLIRGEPNSLVAATDCNAG